MNPWTHDEIEMVRDLASAGLSATKIAATVTRECKILRTAAAVKYACKRERIALHGFAGGAWAEMSVEARAAVAGARMAAQTARERSRAIDEEQRVAIAARKAAEAKAETRVEEMVAALLSGTVAPRVPAPLCGDGGRTSKGAGQFDCRWIVDGGEPGMPLCCGEPVVIGKSYCLAHYARTINPTERVKRVRAAIKLGTAHAASVEIGEAA